MITYCKLIFLLFKAKSWWMRWVNNFVTIARERCSHYIFCTKGIQISAKWCTWNVLYEPLCLAFLGEPYVIDLRVP